jgi:excisionase family DNA binding protein
LLEAISSGLPGNKEESGYVREATPTVLQSSSQAERGTERAIPRVQGFPVARRTASPGVVNLGRQATENATQSSRQDTAAASQAGQAFADLLLVGSTAARCPLALLTVVRGDGWSTLSFGAEREAVEDPQLFAIIAARREPVEVTDPASNPALADSRLARSNLGIRWLLGVPLMGPAGEVNAIFAVLDTEPRELSRRERAAMVAVGRLIAGALSAHRALDSMSGPAPADAANGTRHTAEGHQLLRSHEVAALFDVTERTVINWAASGKLACLRTVGGHLRFRSEDVMSLLEANSLRRPQSAI